MSVMTKNAMLVAESAQAERVEQSDGTGCRHRSNEEYHALWERIYDEALERGSSPDGARFVANERLVRIQADDAGVEPPGVGNGLSY